MCRLRWEEKDFTNYTRTLVLSVLSSQFINNGPKQSYNYRSPFLIIISSLLWLWQPTHKHTLSNVSRRFIPEGSSFEKSSLDFLYSLDTLHTSSQTVSPWPSKSSGLRLLHESPTLCRTSSYTGSSCLVLRFIGAHKWV